MPTPFALALALGASALMVSMPVSAQNTYSPTSALPSIATNHIQSWNTSQESDGSTTLAIGFERPFTETKINSFLSPAGDSLSLDFPGMSVKESARLSGGAHGVVKSVRFVETGRRLRTVIQLDPGSQYRAWAHNGLLIIRLSNNPAIDLSQQNVTVPVLASVTASQLTATKPLSPTIATQVMTTTPVGPSVITQSVSPKGPVVTEPTLFSPSTGGSAPSLRDIEFKKTGKDSGQVILDLSNPSTKVDVHREGANLAIELQGTVLPRNLVRRMRVDDLDTPVIALTPSTKATGSTKLLIEARGGWDYKFSQSGNHVVVDIFKVGDDFTVGGKRVFTGKKLTMSFQQIDVRTALQILGDFTGMNIVASDTVLGNVTLRLNEVPWDQALDVILTSRDLDMRRNGNVIWVAPRSEIISRERQEVEARKALDGREPIINEVFQLNYQKAAVVAIMLTKDVQESDKNVPVAYRPSIRVDERTNQLFVRDTTERLEEMRQLIRQLDTAVKQVNIEAKIVEVSDSFVKNIGVKFGIDGAAMRGGSGGIMLGSNSLNNQWFLNNRSQYVPTLTPYMPSMNVNLPVAGTSAGNFAFTLFNSTLTRFLNLEISAMESDGKLKTVSSPRVMTSDGQEAVIEQGTELPYEEKTSSGATNIAFKKASMILKATPKIAPDGRVNLQLEINKDTVGELTRAGPAIDTKKVRTNVLVDNGGTIVIGGIFVIDESNTVNKVPLLGDIPVIGNAFKNRSTMTTRKELVVMITPRVVDINTMTTPSAPGVAVVDVVKDLKPAVVSQPTRKDRE